MAQRNQDWDDLGKNIQDIVDQAINSRDFRKLNQTITRTVGKAVDLGGEAVRRAVDGAFQNTPYTTQPTQQKTAAPAQKKQEIALLYGNATDKTVGGIVKIAMGIFVALLGVPAFVFSLLMGANVAGMVFGLGVMGGGTGLIWNGISNLGWASRFKTYRKILGQKTYCSLEKLAHSVGKNVKFVRKEVLKMIDTGLFRQGHLDKEETMLITSHETYRYFEQSRLQLEERKRQEAIALEQKKKNAPDPHVQEVIDRGDAFLAQIRKCNDEIPGEEISAKITRMEQIVDRIFDRAETHPEIIPDLKKMMDYYLPMTVKLLMAYAEMDAQPVQGETICNSKKEIEATLDTLNLAFEKLLDQVFADTALDVSSDITVLNTLLAQEGLTEDELTKLKRQQS